MSTRIMRGALGSQEQKHDQHRKKKYDQYR